MIILYISRMIQPICRKDLIHRLKLEFPRVSIQEDGYTWTSERCDPACGDDQYCPPVELEWNELFDRMEKIGLVVVNKKDLVVIQ